MFFALLFASSIFPPRYKIYQVNNSSDIVPSALSIFVSLVLFFQIGPWNFLFTLVLELDEFSLTLQHIMPNVDPKKKKKVRDQSSVGGLNVAFKAPTPR